MSERSQLRPPPAQWLDDDIAKLIAKPHWLGLRTLRIRAHASTGDYGSAAHASPQRRLLARGSDISLRIASITISGWSN